jgi:hypothetical protein
MKPRLWVIVGNDFAGDPDGLPQPAHHALSPSVGSARAADRRPMKSLIRRGLSHKSASRPVGLRRFRYGSELYRV